MKELLHCADAAGHCTLRHAFRAKMVFKAIDEALLHDHKHGLSATHATGFGRLRGRLAWVGVRRLR